MLRTRTFAVLMLVIFAAPWVSSAEESISLPPPRTDTVRPILETLKLRHSTRSFSPKPIPRQVLGELLWAAFGVNRPEEGKRTAPSAHNRQEVDIYVSTAEGTFLYDAFAHALLPITDRDIRALTGKQKFPAAVPVNLVYVVDFARMPGVPRSAAVEAAAVSAGAIAQNVYLYCTSEGLGTVARGWIDRSELSQAMGLRTNQYIILAQTVGYLPQ